MLQKGDKAPEFTLTSDSNEEVSLAGLAGKKVVIYFYPKAGTSGCTRKACYIRDLYPRIRVKDITVVGISPDSPKALAKFRADHSLPFILLSDPDHAVAEAYGAWGTKVMYGRESQGIIRSHFAVDENGVILEAQYKVKPEETAALAESLDQD